MAAVALAVLLLCNRYFAAPIVLQMDCDAEPRELR